MSLPAAWVDHLFAKLATRYGAAFSAMYRDTDPAVVKADWAEVLTGLDGDSIGYGLRYLPTDRPPNAMQFRDACRRAPVQASTRLPAPSIDTASREFVEKTVRRVRDAIGANRSGSPAMLCALRIRAIASARGRMSDAQLHVLRSCERLTGDTSAEFYGSAGGVVVTPPLSVEQAVIE